MLTFLFLDLAANKKTSISVPFSDRAKTSRPRRRSSGESFTKRKSRKLAQLEEQLTRIEQEMRDCADAVLGVPHIRALHSQGGYTPAPAQVLWSEEGRAPRAADRQQAVSVTTGKTAGKLWEDRDRRFCRRQVLTCRFLRVFPSVTPRSSLREGPVQISHGGSAQ